MRTCVVALSVVLGAGALALRAGPVEGAGYDDTNPGATICGDGSHTVNTLRNFYVSDGGLIYAEMQIRWSPTCNTVWTRAVNRTGHGAGYATARSLTSDEEIIVYTCPNTSCMVHWEKKTGDVLPTMDSTGWSHQFVIPAPGATGTPTALQPLTVRGIIWITWSGHTTPVKFDVNLEPAWTWEANGFKNERNLLVDSAVMSCGNAAMPCVVAYTTMYCRIDPVSVPSVLANDLTSTVLPAFSQVNGSPRLLTCGDPCTEDVTICAEPPNGPHIGRGVGVAYQTWSGGPPAHFVSQTIYDRTAYSSGNPRAHACSEGCSSDKNDDRPMLAHEIGHTVGLGHCDTNSGMSVMCAARSINATDPGQLDFNGNHDWHPRSADIQAFGRMH